MAAFDPIFALVMKHEGYYANLVNDQGGMTYAGIARNINPSWQGWRIVDAAISMRGRDLPNNYKIDNGVLDQYVRDFYLELWRKSMAGSINNQQVAALYFDFYVNSGKAIREIQKVLVALGYQVTVDNYPGAQTINAINSYPDQAYLHDAIKNGRIGYLNEVATYGQNASFLPGWMNRLADFPNLSTAQKTVAVGTVLAVVLLGLYLLRKS